MPSASESSSSRRNITAQGDRVCYTKGPRHPFPLRIWGPVFDGTIRKNSSYCRVSHPWTTNIPASPPPKEILSSSPRIDGTKLLKSYTQKFFALVGTYFPVERGFQFWVRPLFFFHFVAHDPSPFPRFLKWPVRHDANRRITVTTLIVFNNNNNNNNNNNKGNAHSMHATINKASKYTVHCVQS
jgi:hypothetical protein